LPYILQRLEYSGSNPKIGVTDTDSKESCEIDLGLGYDIPAFGFWIDRRYCSCGSVIMKRQSLEEDFDLVLSANLNYMCPKCAKADQLNLCTISGVWRDERDMINCHQCYKWSSECVNGYCLYVSMLTRSQSELKVGITRLGRRYQRAAEAGYTLMGILMPEGRNSLSLPEAEFLEKRIISGQVIRIDNQYIKINQRFTQDLGMVGSEPTQELTYNALLTELTDQDRQKFIKVMDCVIQMANAKCVDYQADSAATKLTPLFLAEVIEDPGIQVERERLVRINPRNLINIKSKIYRGRRYRRIPINNRIIGIKGPCIVMDADGTPVIFRLNKFSVAGREIFNPITIIDRKNDEKEMSLDWF
jgi:hypothetical protein